LDKRWYWVKIVLASKPFDKFKGRIVRLAVSNQIFFVNAGIGYRHAVNFMKALISSIAPITLRFAYGGSFHRVSSQSVALC
jgi:hypothetical protein